MSDFLLREWQMPRLRTAVRLSLYNQIQPLVDARGLTEVSAYIDRARAHDVACAEREELWDSQASRGRYAADMADVDPLADRLLFGLQSVALGHRSGLPPDHSLAERIDYFLADLFPGGVAAITGLPYVEQVVAMERCVTRLQGPLAPVVANLAIQPMVDRLAQVTAAYRALVDAGHGRVLFGEVRVARERGHLYLLEIVAMIVSAYRNSNDPAQAGARAELLAPLAEQLAIVRAENRARRGNGEDGGEDGSVPEGDDSGQPEGQPVGEPDAALLDDPGDALVA